MILRLGLRLALRGGREAFVRLILITASVAVGVGVLLTVLADFHAFNATNGRQCWQCTDGAAITRGTPAPGTEFWNYRQDYFEGRVIDRVDVAAAGPSAPAIPGLAAMPVAGTYDVSPAMAALLASTPSDELGDRFPGRQAGLIGQAALGSPNDLVIVIGQAPAALAGLPGAVQVDSISTASRRSSATNLYQFGFGLAAIALVFPLLTLIGTATRLAAARREERFAALRLAGGTPRQVAVIASVEAVVGAALGTIGGIAIFKAAQPIVARAAITGDPYFSNLVNPTALEYAGVVVGVPALAAWAALWSLRRVQISPLGAARRTTPPAPRAWRVLPLLAGLALFIAAPILLKHDATKTVGSNGIPIASGPGDSALLLSMVGLVMIMLGLVVGGSWLTMGGARVMARTARGPAALLSARRLVDNPKAAYRSVGGLVLAVFVGTIVAGVVPAIDSGMRTAGAGTLNDILRATFASAGTSMGPGPANASGGAPATGDQSDQPPPTAAATLGLSSQVGADLLNKLAAFPNAAVLPLYAPQDGTAVMCQSATECAPISGVIPCRSLAPFPVLGTCPAGMTAVESSFGYLLSHDDPTSAPLPIVDSHTPAAGGGTVSLRLEAVLVKEPDAATLERIRTVLSAYTALGGSSTPPKTFGEGASLRAHAYNEVQRVTMAMVAVTLLVAGSSLAVAVGGGLVERKRPFTLLRLAGTATRTLARVVLYESALPLLLAAVVSAAAGFGTAVSITKTLVGDGNSGISWLGPAYYLTLGAGLLASLAVILTALPLLRRITDPGTARFE